MKENLVRILTVLVGLFIFGFALSFFPDAGITGHVSADTNLQTLNLVISQSQTYIISSQSPTPLQLSFIRVTGEIIGKGKASIILDNGKGDRLLLYTNAVKRTEPNLITGMAVAGSSGGAVSGEAKESDLFNLIPGKKLLYLPSIGSDETLTEGRFTNECLETCFIEMELSNQTTYALEFLVSEGTQIRLDNLLYGVLVE